MGRSTGSVGGEHRPDKGPSVLGTAALPPVFAVLPPVQLLDAPNFAHLATLMPDGSPRIAPVWVGREGDRILIATGDGSLKGRNTRRDARVDTGAPFPRRDPAGRIVLVVEADRVRHHTLPFRHTPPR